MLRCCASNWTFLNCDYSASASAPSTPCLPCGDSTNPDTSCMCFPWNTERACLEATCGINLSFSATTKGNLLALKIKRLCNLTLKSPVFSQRRQFLLLPLSLFWAAYREKERVTVVNSGAHCSLGGTRETQRMAGFQKCSSAPRVEHVFCLRACLAGADDLEVTCSLSGFQCLLLVSLV